jgi:hypothetical protein
MNNTMRALVVGALLLAGSVTASAADPAVGTWKLNLAKSTFKPGPAPKSQLRSYVETPQGLLLTVTTVAANGAETTATTTFKDDGKDYPITGNPAFDSISVKRVDENTVNSTQKKAGKVVGHGVRSVAKDGKSLTFKQMAMTPDGKMTDDVMVYDRQ